MSPLARPPRCCCTASGRCCPGRQRRCCTAARRWRLGKPTSWCPTVTACVAGPASAFTTGHCHAMTSSSCRGSRCWRSNGCSETCCVPLDPGMRSPPPISCWRPSRQTGGSSFGRALPSGWPTAVTSAAPGVACGCSGWRPAEPSHRRRVGCCWRSSTWGPAARGQLVGMRAGRHRALPARPCLARPADRAGVRRLRRARGACGGGCAPRRRPPPTWLGRGHSQRRRPEGQSTSGGQGGDGLSTARLPANALSQDSAESSDSAYKI